MPTIDELFICIIENSIKIMPQKYQILKIQILSNFNFVITIIVLNFRSQFIPYYGLNLSRAYNLVGDFDELII
jgi:hypothetical protein